MGTLAVTERYEVHQQLEELLDPVHEIFCCELAMGIHPREAAATAGLSPDSAARLLDKAEIRARIQEVMALRAAEGTPPKAWVEAQMVLQYRRVAGGVPDDALGRQVSVAVSTLMNLAKLKGFIVDKSSKLNLTADLSKLPPTQLAAAIDQRLQSLAPGARKKIEQLQAQVIEAEDTEEL